MQVAATRPLDTLPSLFGRLEGRRAWALAKVRELVGISNDPNRSQADRDSARRGARRITQDLADSAGLTLTPEEIEGAINPLLERIDGWGKGARADGVKTISNAVGGKDSDSVQSPAERDSLSPSDPLVEHSSYHQARKEQVQRSSYARAMEKRRLRENRPSRRSPPSDHMQVLIIDEHGEALRKATLLSDYAHDDGDLTQVTLNHRVDSIDADGSYRPADGPLGARIGIRRECAYPLLTTLHEIGHHIRMCLEPAQVSIIAEAARATQSGKTCKTLGVNVDYWLGDSELFSRVYSQWAVERVADQEALMELRSVLHGADYWQQFSGKEWTAVVQLMDNLMKTKGWL